MSLFGDYYIISVVLSTVIVPDHYEEPQNPFFNENCRLSIAFSPDVWYNCLSIYLAEGFCDNETNI